MGWLYLPTARMTIAPSTAMSTVRTTDSRCARSCSTSWCVATTRATEMTAKAGFSRPSSTSDVPTTKARRQVSRRSTSQNTGRATRTTGIRR